MPDKLILKKISSIYKKMSHAAMRAGRDPHDIKLIAVTKTVPVERIKMAIDAGLRVFGESRVQEAKEKIQSLKFNIQNPVMEWHLIGHLQKNKVKTALELFDCIHSVDSLELAEILNRHAAAIGKTQNILVQVKLSYEESKHGILKDNLLKHLNFIARLKHLSVRGLMTIPPYFENPEDARPYFRELRKLRDKAEAQGFKLPELSMGMTNDFETAIEEGATMVRIGTAIFGEREYNK